LIANNPKLSTLFRRFSADSIRLGGKLPHRQAQARDNCGQFTQEQQDSLMTTSPKVSTLSSSARRALRAAAHHLDPVVMMGQHGLTPAVLHEIDLALTAHALIKVRAGSDEREVRDGYLTDICDKLACESVQHLGKLFVLWRNADGADNPDKSAVQDAAAVKASNDPQADKARGPRSKLPSERAAERANAAPAGRSGGYAARGGPPAGGRGAPAGGRGDSTNGPRWRYGEAPPDAPRREGWAPKDRRGAARFGEGGDDSRRRDAGASYGAPRGRPAGGFSGGARSSGGGGADVGGRSSGSGGSGGYGGAGGSSSYGGDNRGGAGGGYGGGGGFGSRSSYGGQGDAAPRARWGEQRREPSQGGGYGQGGGNSGGGSFGSGRGAPAPRSTYSRGDAGGFDRAPRSGGGDAGGGGGGWGNRDGVTGKPSGFSRGGAGGGAGGAGGAAPRARRRFG
jgi:putative YhbY family RNA-binding protein